MKAIQTGNRPQPPVQIQELKSASALSETDVTAADRLRTAELRDQVFSHLTHGTQFTMPSSSSPEGLRRDLQTDSIRTLVAVRNDLVIATAGLRVATEGIPDIPYQAQVVNVARAKAEAGNEPVDRLLDELDILAIEEHASSVATTVTSPEAARILRERQWVPLGEGLMAREVTVMLVPQPAEPMQTEATVIPFPRQS